MKMNAKDFAALMSGATVIITDCSIQVFCGKVGNGEEATADSDYQTTAIGFMAEEQTGGEDDEVEDEDFEEARVAKL